MTRQQARAKAIQDADSALKVIELAAQKIQRENPGLSIFQCRARALEKNATAYNSYLLAKQRQSELS